MKRVPAPGSVSSVSVPQVTADLPGFWAGSWAAVRKDLAGRYPKHRWPADPAGESPGRLKPR